MTTCPRTEGDRARRAARGLEHCETVLDALVLDPNAGPRNEWTIEATITGDRLPNEAVQVLADQDCTVVSTALRAPDVTQAVVAV